MIAVDRLAPLAADAVRRLPVRLGRQVEELGAFLDAVGDAGDGTVLIEGDLARFHRVGQRMASGRLEVNGSLGRHAGSEMSGGVIRVRGRVGDQAGAGMRGGVLEVEGSAGDGLGGAYPGQALGMREGVIRVRGDAGDDVGLAMRRGWITVAGRCGRRAGRGMVAGSLFALGGAGADLGFGMKRGTILLGGPGTPVDRLRFPYACRYRPALLALYLDRLREWGGDAAIGGVVDRYNGDVVEGGQGEILVAVRESS